MLEITYPENLSGDADKLAHNKKVHTISLYKETSLNKETVLTYRFFVRTISSYKETGKRYLRAVSLYVHTVKETVCMYVPFLCMKKWYAVP